MGLDGTTRDDGESGSGSCGSGQGLACEHRSPLGLLELEGEGRVKSPCDRSARVWRDLRRAGARVHAGPRRVWKALR